MGAGRPRKEFNQKLFEELCHIQCTETEIAAVMDMDTNTLEKNIREIYNRNFSEVFAEKREGGRSSLRRAQWKKAIESNDTVMQIFLGKNLLNQKDKPEKDEEEPANLLQTSAELLLKAHQLLSELKK